MMSKSLYHHRDLGERAEPERVVGHAHVQPPDRRGLLVFCFFFGSLKPSTATPFALLDYAPIITTRQTWTLRRSGLGMAIKNKMI